MIGRTNTGGGGGFSAVIAVYGATSNAIVTATSSRLSVSVTSDAQGTAYIYVTAPGSYTVSCTGKNNLYVTVDRTDDKHVVKAFYKLYLYTSGTFHPDYSYDNVTSAASVSYGSTYVQVTTNANSASYGYLYFASVPLTGRSKITAQFNMTSNYKNPPTVLVNDVIGNAIEGNYILMERDNTSGGASIKTVELDISSLTSGSYYVQVGLDTAGASWANSRVGRILNVSVT